MPGITSTPDFNKNDIKGWNTRLIFSQNIRTNLNLTTTNYFDAVAPSFTRGTLGQFPSGYWMDGRILRLKASLNYSYGNKLDIEAAITDGTNSIRCSQNNGNSHDFAGGNGPANVPVTLEITFVRGGHDNSFAMSGFYQYEWGSYDAGGTNGKVVYVPMTYVVDDEIDFSSPTQLGLFINNEPIEIDWLTIEELG